MTTKRRFLLLSLVTGLVACDSSALRVTNAAIPVESSAGIIVEPQIGVSEGAACIDTTPVGDGWGWNGTASCQIEIDRISQLGFLKLQPDKTKADFASALFTNLQTPLTPEQIEAVYVPTLDTCQVIPVASNNSDELPLTAFGQPLELIDAGDTVILSSSTGTYATLTSDQGLFGPTYETEVSLNAEPPPGLTVSVVGAEFPAFPDVVIDEVPALQLTNPPAGQNIDAFNYFQWNANNAALSVVEIYTSGIAANGQEVLVACTVVDDGSFSFPESVRAQMGSAFDDNWTTYLRIVYHLARNGDALLITANSAEGTR